MVCYRQVHRRDMVDDATCQMSMSDLDEALTDVPDIESCKGILARQAKRKLDREDSGIHTMSFRSTNNRVIHEGLMETPGSLMGHDALGGFQDSEFRMYKFRPPRSEQNKGLDYLELMPVGPLDEIDELVEDKRRADKPYRSVIGNHNLLGLSGIDLISATIPSAPDVKTTKLDLPLTFENTLAIRGKAPRDRTVKDSAIAALCAQTIPNKAKKQRIEKLQMNLEKIQTELSGLEDTVTYV